MYLQLFRIDDICDKMKNEELVFELIEILNSYNVKPLLGVIPEVKDEKLISEENNFKLEDLKPFIKNKKVEIAIHGLNHQYISKNKGINPRSITSNSEFAGLSYKQQFMKIKRSKEIIKKRLNINPKYFFAPNHSYDLNTLRVLKEFNLINVDGISLYPFEFKGVFHIPQVRGSIKEKFFWYKKEGVIVDLYHPFSLNKRLIKETEKFCKKNKDYLTNFEYIIKNKEYFLGLNKKYKFKNLMFKSWIKLKFTVYKILKSIN